MLYANAIYVSSWHIELRIYQKNPIQTEAKNILNKLFQDDFGFFDSGKANRVEWFLPKEIKDMNLFYEIIYFGKPLPIK